MKISEYSGFIFDLDGVIWRGKAMVPGANETVRRLRAAGKKVAFVTNYAAESHAFQLNKLRSMGIDASAEELVTSGSACARYLSETKPGVKVHVFGPQTLVDQLTAFGIEVVDVDADAIVVARDEDFSMRSLDAAFQNLLRPGCEYIVCAANPVHPGANGRLHPGGGTMVAALSFCSGRTPDLVVGKPNTFMPEMALKNFGLPASECVMLGDILDVDIVCGQNAGLETIFLLSGVGKREDIERLGITPTHVLASVADIIP